MAIRNSDGSIILTTQIDESGIKKGTRSIKAQATQLSSSLKSLGVQLATVFSVKAIIEFSKASAEMASKTEASIQRLIDIYGEANKELTEFINNNARLLGLSKSAAQSFSAVYGNLFSVWADQSLNAELTARYLRMTAVVATKTGRTMEDVQERIRSGLLGNTEAVEDLGIFVNVKTIEMTKAFQKVADGQSWEKLSAEQQSQIRTLAILEQATNKYGNEVANTTTLVKSRYAAAYEDFKNSWGQVVNLILVPIMKALTIVFDALAKFLNMLLGLGNKNQIVEQTKEQNDLIEKSAENQEKLKNNIKETAKEQKKALADFDDAQILTSAASTNSSGSTSSNLNLGDVNSIFGEESGFSVLEKNISTENLDQWRSESETKLGGFWAWYKDNFAVEINDTNESISTSFSDISTAFQTSSDKIKTEIAPKLIDTTKNEIYPVLGGIISEFSSTGAKLFEGAGDTITDLTDNVFLPTLNTWAETWDDTWKLINDTWELNGKPMFDSINGFIDDVKNGLTFLQKEVVEKIVAWWSEKWASEWREKFFPMLEELTENFGKLGEAIDDLYQNVLKPLFDKIAEVFAPWAVQITQFILSVSTAFLELIGNLFNGAVTLITGIINIITGLFSGDLTVILEGFTQIAEGIIKIIGGLVESLVNLVIEGINGIIRAVNPVIETFTGKANFLSEIDKINFDTNFHKPSEETIQRSKAAAYQNLQDRLQSQTQPPEHFQNLLAENGYQLSKGENGQTIILELDGRELGRAVANVSGSESRRAGITLVHGGASGKW